MTGFSEFSEACEELEKSPSKLRKSEIIASLLKKSGRDDLYKTVMLLQGKVFPSYDEREIGIAAQSMAKIIAQATGFSEKEVSGAFKKEGDFGIVAEELMKKRKQKVLLQTPLTVKKVFENLQKVAEVEGKGSQERKFKLVAELISAAKPKEAKYIVRTTIGDLRIGVAEGIMRDAIADAFLGAKTPEEKKEAVSAVEWAWFLRPDYGDIAETARDKGVAGLKKIGVVIGKPYHVLLAERSPGLKEAVESFENAALEFKYDGARIIIHKRGEKIWLFTRRLENITRQFPEVVEYARQCVHAKECIIEGEMLGFNKSTGKPMPFQFLSQRIKRKYDIDKMASEIPTQVNLFEIVYLEGKELFDKTLSERWKALKGIIRPVKGKFQLAEHLETNDIMEAERFYKEALAASQEGLIVKNLDAQYQPGRRVSGGWLKVKPIMETLDLAIIGATWGTGKRTGWMGSFTLGCKDGDDFKECGMIGTGVKEKADSGEVTFEELTELLRPNIIKESGNSLKIRPDVIVEVAYEEIQESPTYGSGYALRFPRVVKIRPDKDVSEADTKERIRRLYIQQKGKIRG
jgi:DNA ligase-1